MFDEAIKKNDGAPKGNKNASKTKTTVDNVNGCFRPEGNSKQRAIRRLREASKADKKVRVLYDKVLKGDMSPHAAMIQAGFFD